MILCLDIGNTHIYGGVFDGEDLALRFRKPSQVRASSDEIGLFLKSVLRENNIQPENIQAIGLCSVVPDAIYSTRSACKKYFDRTPFELNAEVSSGLKVSYNNPKDVGADRIANAIAASTMYPNRNLVLVDFGTATTFCAVSKDREYLGGVILPGLRIGMEALEDRTAKLPPVEIVKRQKVIGQDTISCIQSGIYFGNLGMVKEVLSQIQNEAFSDTEPFVVATGGFAYLFKESNLFDKIEADLVLHGIRLAMTHEHN
ncbi:MAG: pantothenate kinase [Myxococcales bacterium]|nr:pantothenate kinase [Myxococcales bacterium]